jgi:glycosyltransferase involved in cell wall biosynthesis
MKHNKRILIFQSEWAIQIHTIELINKLAENGFEIKIFIKNCSEKYINLSDDLSKIVKVHRFDNSSIKKFNILNILIRFLRNRFISKEMICFVLKNTSLFRKYVLIGIEKEGLLWAGVIKKFRFSTLIYHSLELYIENPGNLSIDDFRKIRKLEINFHKNANGLVIQDCKREKILLEANQIFKSNTFYLPILLSDEAVIEKINSIDKKNQLVYFGAIRPQRLSLEIISIADSLPPNFTLRMHGPIEGGIQITPNTKANLLVSSENYTQSEIDDLILKSKIGLCIYDNNRINDRLTANSSEKLVRYLRFGLPIIAFRNESYLEINDKYQCCELVDNINEIPIAVEKIINDYQTYSKNAIKAFENHYRLENYISEYIKFLESA